jgi:hypothetical protein
MKTKEMTEKELGAVAFLDVLGMKGIWQQDIKIAWSDSRNNQKIKRNFRSLRCFIRISEI